MLPSQRYAAGVALGDWLHDPAQLPALAELDRIHAALTTPASARGLFARMFGTAPPAAIPGLYLWGGVGRGKTFLMDLFVASLPHGVALRRHFHRFMGEVHASLRELNVQLLEQTGDSARLRLRYRLAKRDIDAIVPAVRIDGHWYLADFVTRAEASVVSGMGSGKPASP